MNELPPHSAPALLCLDASTQRLHLSCDHGAQVASLDLDGGAAASRGVLAGLQSVLDQSGAGWQQLAAVAYGRGPGAFTGLRTACAVAQGLALGRNCALIAIDTLMAVAESAWRQRRAAGEVAELPPGGVGPEFWVLQDARMDELYVGAYRRVGDGWQETQAPALWPLMEPDRRWPPQLRADDADAGGPWWCGNALSVTALTRSGATGAAWRQRWIEACPDGAALASLARRAWARGDTHDAALALPVYVRDRVAQTLAERARLPGDVALASAAAAES